MKHSCSNFARARQNILPAAPSSIRTAETKYVAQYTRQETASAEEWLSHEKQPNYYKERLAVATLSDVLAARDGMGLQASTFLA